ncbi:MAG: helix-turn-helix domain-containing protein [Oscillochloridaceae bacterium umkhey_bin13]
MPKRMRDLPSEYQNRRQLLGQAIGGRILARRDHLELTQDMLRARLELNQVWLSRSQLSRIENGEVLLDVLQLLALSDALGVTYHWLLTGEG